MKRNRRVTYRPSKAQSTFSGIVGIVFVIIGVFMVIPTFGLIGIAWTLIAAGMAGYHLYQAFGGKYIGPEIEIEEEGAGETVQKPQAAGTQQRLEELRGLYD